MKLAAKPQASATDLEREKKNTMNLRHQVSGSARSLGLSATALATFLLVAQPAPADVTTYTSSAEFFAALGGKTLVIEDYESYDLDMTIPPGTKLMGVTYTSWPTAFGGLIGDDFANIDTRSLYLERNGDPGQGDGDFFFPGDTFSVAFDTPVTAIGMFFNVVPGAGEFMFIETPVGTTATGGFEPDMGTFFFAGLISDESFGTATIGSTLSAPSGWNADNLVFAPIPAPAALALFGAAGLFIRRRRR